MKTIPVKVIRINASVACLVDDEDYSLLKDRKWSMRKKGTKFYKTWENIKQRCNNPNNTKAKHYFEKGIRCVWDQFVDFQKDMYESYQVHVKQHGEKNTTIERKDSNGNYCKENCRWATWSEQQNNTSRNRHITLNGKTQNMKQWCDELGLSLQTVSSRINSYGFTPEEALTWKKYAKHKTK